MSAAPRARAPKAKARKGAKRAARPRTAAQRTPAKPRTPGTRARATPHREAAPGVASAAVKLAGVGSEAVLRATGRAWDEWLKVLDRAGAATLPHREIAQLVSSRFSVPGWWSQMLTLGYEQARGRRAPGQRADGLFSAHASRTVHIGLDKLYTAWSEPAQRSRWLPGAPLEVRRATGGKSMRITWTVGGSDVDVSFAPKGRGRSKVAIEHARLPDAQAASLQKAYWAEALARLKALLERKP